MLSDTLSEVASDLTEGLVWYSQPEPFRYDDDTLAEVRDIIKRVNVLRIRLDMLPCVDAAWSSDEHILQIEQQQYDADVVGLQAAVKQEQDELAAAVAVTQRRPNIV